jgi:hypothetical protein
MLRLQGKQQKNASLTTKTPKKLTKRSLKKQPLKTSKRTFKNLPTYVEPKPHKQQAPDLFSRQPEWDRKALDADPYPQTDIDGFLTEDDQAATPPFTNDDMTALMEETYERNPLDIRFDNFRKLTALSGIPRFDMGNTKFHIGLHHLVSELRHESSNDYHFNLTLEACYRTMDPELYSDTIDVFKAKGFQPSLQQLAPLIHMSWFRRDPAVFDKIMGVVGHDMTKWDTGVAENVIQFHEMHQHWDEADKIFAQSVAAKLIPVPWKHQRQSHINAAKFAQKVPSRRPKWDEPTPEADIIHLDGSPILLSRPKMRYACYSMQDMCENNGKVHPKINIPHNIVVQSVVRGANAPQGLNMYHRLWQPVQQEVKDYLVKFGIQTKHIARAANLFWIDHMYFDRLPTPGNQNPQKKPEYRQFKTEGLRALEIKYAAEDAAKNAAKEAQIAAFHASLQKKSEARM